MEKEKKKERKKLTHKKVGGPRYRVNAHPHPAS